MGDGTVRTYDPLAVRRMEWRSEHVRWFEQMMCLSSVMASGYFVTAGISRAHRGFSVVAFVAGIVSVCVYEASRRHRRKLLDELIELIQTGHLADDFT